MKRILIITSLFLLSASMLMSQNAYPVLPYYAEPDILIDSIVLQFSANTATRDCWISLYSDDPYPPLTTTEQSWIIGSNSIYFPHVVSVNDAVDLNDVYATWGGTYGPWGDTQQHIPDPDQFSCSEHEYNGLVNHNGIWYAKVFAVGSVTFCNRGDITLNFDSTQDFHTCGAQLDDNGTMVDLTWSQGETSLVYEDYVLDGFLEDASILVTGHDRWGTSQYFTFYDDDFNITYDETFKAHCTIPSPIDFNNLTSTATVKLNLSVNYGVKEATSWLYHAVGADTTWIRKETTEVHSGMNRISFGSVTLTGSQYYANLGVIVRAFSPWGHEYKTYDIGGLSTPNQYNVSETSAVLIFQDPGDDRKNMLKNRWNWYSFPRLDSRDAGGNVNAETFFATLAANGSIKKVLGHENGYDIYMELDHLGHWQHYDLTDINSVKGYKIEMNDNYIEWEIDGTMESRYKQFDLHDDDENWIGYFLPNGCNIRAAFDECWDDIVSVKSRTWYYRRSAGGTPRDPNEPEPLPSANPRGKNLYYGRSYIVEVDSDVRNFSWDSQVQPLTIPGNEKGDVENFAVVEQADYEAIDILDIDSDITEIGVFEGDICVGACVVDTTAVTLLAYTSDANRSVEPLVFKVVRNRSGKPRYAEYSVRDEKSGKYVNRAIIAGMQDHSVVRLTAVDESEDTPVYGITLQQNSPNPFNPSTWISFTLKVEAEVEITVFNIRGEKVVTLMNGMAAAGQNTVHWDGQDSTGRSVASGVYLYRLTAGGRSYQRKMLMLK